MSRLPSVLFSDFLDVHTGNTGNTLLVNVRGSNGSGKSTIPMQMMESDPYAYEVVWAMTPRMRTAVTVFPSYKFLSLGHYHSKCGGMDTMKTTQEIKDVLGLVWNTDFNILMEGVLASTVRQTYLDLFTDMNVVNDLQREIIIYNILPPVETCLQRIALRNGGKPINEELVARKRRMVELAIPHFKQAGFTVYELDNTDVAKDDTLKWFYDTIGADMPLDITSV